MNSCTLKEILKVNFLSFTKEEIENIMEEELEKSPEEMDAELVDMCLEILTGEQEKKADEKLTGSSAESEKKVKKINFKKGILVAAIITLLITIAIPVGARIFEINIPESMLKIYEDRFKLDASKDNSENDLDALLAKHDLSDTVLPTYLFSGCEISNFEKYDDESVFNVSFEYIDDEEKIKGKVTVNNLNENEYFSEDDLMVNDQYEKADKIVVNGIEVFVFNEGNKGLIVYFIDGIEYNIKMSGVTFEKVVGIASTL